MNIKYLILFCICAASLNLLGKENEELGGLVDKIGGSFENLDALKQFFQDGKAAVTDTYKNEPILNYAISEYIFELVTQSNKKQPKEIKNKKEIVYFLLEKNAPINLVDTNGDTPLHIASGKGLKYVLAGMIEQLGNKKLLEELIMLLLQKGADINAQNKEGDTPLHKAMQALSPARVELLLKHGAKTNIPDNRGMTAYAKAHEEAIEAKEIYNENMQMKLNQPVIQMIKQEMELTEEIKKLFDEYAKLPGLQKVGAKSPGDAGVSFK